MNQISTEVVAGISLLLVLVVIGLVFAWRRRAKQLPSVSVSVSTPIPELAKPERSLGLALKSTREGFVARIAQALGRTPHIDQQLWEELEAILFSADVGVRTAQKLIDRIRIRAVSEKIVDSVALQELLVDEIRQILRVGQWQKSVDGDQVPHVELFVGVNGVGKTTTIGKLAQQYQLSGYEVVLGAGDTFRAAAGEQLSVWAERAQVDIIHGAPGGDPASVLFDAVKFAQKNGKNMVLCDTAGRLHTKIGLMDELKKIHRVLNNALPGAPHEVYLVLDATTGQNAIMQAKQFMEATPLSGLILTKVDGTAKGGVIIGIVDELNIPVKYIGMGEAIGDLRPFIADDFINGLFGK